MEILNKEAYTPMIQQYLEIKKDYLDSIVFFRLGDFYEMFFEDAVLASRILEIALTGKDAGVSERVPMCGIPFHAYQTYAEKLISAGKKVVIVEQVEDPTKAKGIVKRDVVKILTPGTIVDDFMAPTNNYLCAIYNIKNTFLIAYSDISTGEAYLTLGNGFKRVLELIRGLNIKEVVVCSNFSPSLASDLEKENYLVSYEDNYEIPSYLEYITKGIDVSYRNVIGILLNYAIKTQKSELRHFKEVKFYTDKDYLRLDYFTKRNLELTETLRFNDRNGSLLGLIDKTKTAMGSRMIRKWLDRPLVELDKIVKRQNYIEAFIDDFITRKDIIDSLKEVYDLERIIGRISCLNANAKDLVQLRRTLSKTPLIKEKLKVSGNSLLEELGELIDCHEELFTLLENALEDNPPLTIKEGKMIKYGYNSELDELKNISQNSYQWLSNYEAQEKERLNVKNLKIGYNKVFGYFIEISKGQALNLGDIEGYERRQTLANSERYITKELKKYEDILLGAKDKIEKIEYDLFIDIRENVSKYIASLQGLADIISEIDSYISLAEIAIDANFVKPTFADTVEIIDGRHPVLEALIKERYVANDIYINDYNMILITGPNMSGKSTYMRMFATIIILAQIGSFVPARIAKLKLFDQIFTRIGASDDLSSGQSTFMVEMSEANYALTNATTNSLILFDEIGRGTATYDGMALAQAILEYIHQKVGAVTLFSTHYHELTSLESTLKRLKNVHVEAVEVNGGVSFLHKVKDGPTDKSYGINVAHLAGMPKSLINRANLILEDLEKNSNIKGGNLSLFNFDDDISEKEEKPEVISYLEDLDVDELSPKEALNILYELKAKYGGLNG